MWDNRIAKRNPKAPDFKCRSRSCDGVIWPPRREPFDARAADGRGEYANDDADDGGDDYNTQESVRGLEPLPF